jgi:hypothetical protein
MPKTTYAEVINKAQVMATGLQSNITLSAQRGWSTTNNAKLISTRADVIKLNDEQERLKASLKTKTAELNEKLTDLKAQMKEGKKVVKLAFPQSQWKEFGIADKR